MTLSGLKNKKIAILGLGIENHALIKYLLKKKLKTEITICDARSKEQLGEKYLEFEKEKNINWRLGEEFNHGLYEFDILFRSPGWPIFCPGIREALMKPKVILSSPMKLFFDLCPSKIIGVTGTKGKGTTASLIYAILKTAKKRVWLGGNIGVAPFTFLNKIKKGDWVVLEISSFQLEDMEASPHIAVITNFYPEHLRPADPINPNYHESLRVYWEAKMNVIRYQKKGDYAILNSKFRRQKSKLSPPWRDPAFNNKNKVAGQFKIQNLRSKIIYFDKSESKSNLIGEHNKENVAAAQVVAEIVGAKKTDIIRGVLKFKGLEHRLEHVRALNGVDYFNDTFATTPESSIIALKAFARPIILLAGGADKGSNFHEFAKEIKKRAKFVILLDGKATPRIKKELSRSHFEKKKMKTVFGMEEAVKVAFENAQKNDIVLLSTACASFGMFKNYKERGKLFKREVNLLK